jgi:isopropylmalate/homocitrate/citramalate synthase
MGAQKDIDRIRELIIGEDIKRFEAGFDAMELRLNKIEERQNLLVKKVKKRLKKHHNKLVNTEEISTRTAKGLKHQGRKIDVYMKDISKEIESVTQSSAKELKTFKTELVMHIESKLNSMGKTNISKKQLAKMFATLSLELEDNSETKKHAKQ